MQGHVIHPFTGKVDFTKMILVFHKVIMQCIKKTFGMFRCHDNTVLHFCLYNSGHHAYEVKHKFAAGMGDDGQIRIAALCYVFRQLTVDPSLGVSFDNRARRCYTSSIFIYICV